MLDDGLAINAQGPVRRGRTNPVEEADKETQLLNDGGSAQFRILRVRAVEGRPEKLRAKDAPSRRGKGHQLLSTCQWVSKSNDRGKVMSDVRSYKPLEIAADSRQSVFVRPEDQRQADHLEAGQQQIAFVYLTISEHQPLREEDILEMLQLNQQPGIHGFDVHARVAEVLGTVDQALGEL